MNLNETLAAAKSHGWQEDWKRANVAHQISTERDGVLGFVKVLIDGAINWSVSGDPETPNGRGLPSRRGSARTLDDAINACESSLNEATGTLF